MHPVLLLAIYCVLSVVASLAGGWVPFVVRLTHRRMQIAISFVSGMMLGIGLLHLVPHSFHILHSIDRTMIWVLTGFLCMFFLERFFHFHHHDVPEDEPGGNIGAHAHLHSHNHGHDHAHEHDELPHAHAHVASSSLFPWGAAAIGLTLHSLVDGVTIAAAVAAESGHDAVALGGIGAFLAIFLHKPFDSLTIGTLMAAAHRSPAARHWINALYALVTPLGIALFYLASSGAAQSPLLGPTLAFAGGAFLCIASSDLLPELQFHRHDRFALSLSLLLGIALAWSTMFLEAAGHDHNHPASASEADHPHDEHADDDSGGHEGHDHQGHTHSHK